MQVSVISTPKARSAVIVRLSRIAIPSVWRSRRYTAKSSPRGSVIAGTRTRRSVSGTAARPSRKRTPASPNDSVSAMMRACETGTKSSASKNSPTAIWCEMAQRRTSPSSAASIALSSSVSRMAGRISRRNHKLTKELHNVLSAANQQQNPAQVVTSIPVLTGRPTSAPEPPFAVLSEGDGRRRSEENKRVGCDRRADAAPVQAKDPKRAEDERDPVQSDAHQVNQLVHGVHDAQTASFYRPTSVIQRRPPPCFLSENGGGADSRQREAALPDLANTRAKIVSTCLRW